MPILSFADFYSIKSGKISSIKMTSRHRSFKCFNPFQNNCITSRNGTAKLSQYKFSNHKLGTGAFATVYLAQHIRTKTNVAMKIIRLHNLEDRYIKLSMNEIALLKMVPSPNIVKFYDAFVSYKVCYLALELIDGSDLEVLIQQLRNRGRIFSERAIWYIYHQICNGVKDLHNKRILHRDLKPANIFMTSKWIVKIGDLGLSLQLPAKTKTIKGSVGTQYYMAPERNNGNGYTFSSDIWSMGCILYEMCALQSPFAGEKSNVYALHKKINSGIDEIIPFSMNIKPDERPSANECAEASRAMFQKFQSMFDESKKGSNSAKRRRRF